MDFLTLSQYDTNMLVQFPPLSDPISLTAKYVTITSTLGHYEWIERFTTMFPHRIQELPDAVFGPLILESNDPCDCSNRQCKKPHIRTWSSNIGTINILGKKHLVTEFRVIAHGASKRLLNINVELMKLEQMLGGPLLGVRKIFFTGVDLTEAGAEDIDASNIDSRCAVEAIRKMFPGATDVTYHPHTGWGVSPGYIKLSSTACKLVGMTISAYFHQLQNLQLHMTTPLTFHKFCKELVSLSINVEYVRPHKQLPPIPIGSLRVLHLMRIDGAIPWPLFQAVGSQLDFACLKELTLEFIVDVEGRVSFPGFVYPVIFSALDILRVFHATSVYSDVFAHFVNNRLSKLIVMDDPSIFGQIDWRVLQNVKRLEVRHPTDEFYETKYSSTAVHQLFSQLSSVTEVNMIGKVYYPAPIDIKWFNLVSLELAVAITDKDTLANMLTQLPRLKKLHISCRSMDRNDSHLTAYPDEQNAPLRLQTLVDVEYDDGDESKTVSKTLLRFDFYSHRAFDEHGVCQLLCRLPNVRNCSINRSRTASVERLLYGYYRLRRLITMESYPEPLDFGLNFPV